MGKLFARHLETLRSSVLFEGFGIEEISELMKRSEFAVETHRSGELLMSKDTALHILGILIKGSATVTRYQGNGQMHMSRLAKSDIFGAASLFSSEKEYVVDIRCTTDCRTILISEIQLIRWMQLDSRILYNYLKYLTGRIRFLNRRLDALTETSVSLRIMTFLSGASKDGNCRVKSCQELAQALCLSRATLYRALDTLCSEGKISRKGKQIILLEEI